MILMLEKLFPFSLLAIVVLTTIALPGCLGDHNGTPAQGPEPGPGNVYLFNQTNNGETRDISLDADLLLILPENPTTGFLWQLSVTPGLSIENESFMPDDPSGTLVGSGGTHLWRMRTTQPGMQSVSGVYARPWESSAGDQFTLNLRVGGETSTEVPPGKSAIYTEGDDGTTVQQEKGREFGIRLEENPTTGYSWNLTLPRGLLLAGDSYIPSHQAGGIAGAGGIHAYVITAVEPGEHPVHGEYRRPWVPAGTILYVDLEGGFYGIAGDDGTMYLPMNLEPEFRNDGQRVAFEYESVIDAATIQMWGTPITLTYIEKVTTYDLYVVVR